MLIFGMVYYCLYEINLDLNFNTINTLLSGYGILWYLNMLFWCFIVAYPISKKVKSNYFQLFILLISFALIYVKCPAVMGLDNFCRMFFYFYFGTLFSETILKHKVWSSKILIAIVGVIFLVSYFIYEYNVFCDMNNQKIKFITGNSLRISFILFVIILIRSFEKKLNYNFIIKYLDENSFGCYIFHYPIIYFLYKSNITMINSFHNNWLFPVISFFSAVIISYQFTYYLRRLKVGCFLLG